MIRGTTGLRAALEDRQSVPPGCTCGRCGGELYPGEAGYLWEDRQICLDCFKAEVGAWLEASAVEVASALGVETREVTD